MLVTLTMTTTAFLMNATLIPLVALIATRTVKMTLVKEDCDADGEIDACENGDVDGDGIPDECDADSCGTTEPDCDQNGVADECEPTATLMVSLMPPAMTTTTTMASQMNATLIHGRAVRRLRWQRCG